MALQNRRALDLLMAEKGRTCRFLREDCFWFCFFFFFFLVNASEIVQNKVRELKESIRLGQAKSDGFDFSGWWKSSWAKWLLPLLGPLTALFLILLIGPCVFQIILRRVRDLTQKLLDRC